MNFGERARQLVVQEALETMSRQRRNPVDAA